MLPTPNLVSQEWNDLCTSLHVEARVTVASNPGDPYRPTRMVHFRNYNNDVITVQQFNKKGSVLHIPANGEGDIMLLPDEPLPMIEKGI